MLLPSLSFCKFGYTYINCNCVNGDLWKSEYRIEKQNLPLVPWREVEGGQGWQRIEPSSLGVMWTDMESGQQLRLLYN